QHGKDIKAKLVKINGKKANLKNAVDVESIEKDLMHKPYQVSEIDVKDKTLHAYPPFTTSTLQQAGNNLLGLGAKRTMGIAQALYQQGYITYMRTDSVNLSEDAIKQFRGFISHSQNLGDAYLPETPNYYKNKSRNAQEAHEAIRPTDITKTSAELGLGAQEAKLYDLIWRRALASQMNSYRAQVYTAHIVPDGNSKYDFVVLAQKTIFDGFKKIWNFKSLDELGIQEISDMKQGDELKYVNLDKQQKFTKPKARYTEATLVKALESLGVGRPSTYATIISTIQDRGYVDKVERKLVPTDTGFVVDKFLEKNFNRLVDYQYTAKVEERLDDISEGKLKYVPFMDEEYKPLVKELKLANDNADKEDYVVLGDSDEKCPECGSKMVIKLGKYGKFLSCSKFPECKGMKSLVDETINFDKEKYITPDKCPKCGKKVVLKNGRYGIYWACEDYPDCKGALPLMLKQTCPDCGKNLVERKSRWGKSFIGCSGYPDCTYIQKADGTRAVSRTFKKGKKKTKARSVRKVSKGKTRKSATKTRAKSKSKK
ncbi:MAG TPA: DNA topoisomerase, partial [Candidatus Dojkabacteria bacterium]|nr:DNA topoisomerase [Candidatus Dojkabacteria bacterium]